MKKRSIGIAVAMVVSLLPTTVGAGGGKPPVFAPGSSGLGDPYFPSDGNGGYDVDHYALDIKYDPATGVLDGKATITAEATQNLSAFNLDFLGLDIASIRVNGNRATYSRDGDELTVTPTRGIRRHDRFTTVVRYSGVPQLIEEPATGVNGFFATDDGAMIVGQPHVASMWFPVNDHPSDAASYSFEVTVPKGVEAIANGVLKGKHTSHGWTTWSWDAKDPMASYLATVAIGQFEVTSYRDHGLPIVDAIDPDLFTPPVSLLDGDALLISQQSSLSYKRVTHVVNVPTEGAQLTFWVARATEEPWDYFFVEAHTVGADNWTTLPEQSGITSDDTGFSCPFWLTIHPFLTHYQADNGDDTCSPVGSSGTWNAATGVDPTWTQWTIDLSAYHDQQIEVSLSYASDDIVQLPGVAIDDVVVSTGEGTTSFEADTDPWDGWTVAGAPEGSPGNDNDWTIGGQADLPKADGTIAAETFAREPEMLDFLADNFGRYPFRAAGGIVDDLPGVGFALENQTRPVYAREFFSDPVGAASVVVHELAHQWYGDSVRLDRWADIWLNEGFATYAEWLWSEHEGLGTPQDIFDFYFAVIESNDPFWTVTIGDPGPDSLFDGAVYLRGAMTLQALRNTVGDDNFFRIMRSWARVHRGEAVTTSQFIALAESISHMDLDDLFNAWLYTPAMPPPPPQPATTLAANARVGSQPAPSAPAVARAELRRLQRVI